MITFINTQPPHANDAARNALDMTMMAVSMDQPVQVIFMHDGIWQLIARQSDAIEQKNPLVKYRILSDVFELDTLYVCSHSLAQRQLTSAQLEVSAQPLDAQDIVEKLALSKHVVRF